MIKWLFGWWLLVWVKWFQHPFFNTHPWSSCWTWFSIWPWNI